MTLSEWEDAVVAAYLLGRTPAAYEVLLMRPELRGHVWYLEEQQRTGQHGIWQRCSRCLAVRQLDIVAVSMTEVRPHIVWWPSATVPGGRPTLTDLECV